MRVVAGKYKRRNLVAPPGEDITRPTSDRVKESLFNILTPHLEDSLVLDLFAGTGSLGIEALSRGARKVIFVERDKSAFQCLLQNINRLQIPAHQVVTLCCEVEKFLVNPTAWLPKTGSAEDFAASISLVLADPPYQSPWYDSAIESLEKSNLCSDECVVALEMSRSRAMKSSENTEWERVDERQYGQTRLEIWHRKKQEPE